MASIKSRKHPAAKAVPYMAGAAAATLVSLSLPVAAQTASTLKEVQVQGSAASDYKADTSANTKFTAPLVDTPQTVQVIREQIMREQGATTLTEALRNTAGASAFYLGENGSTSTGDTIYMRGFDTSSSIFVDGIRDLSSVSRDVFNIEQVEVVKGPAGTDTGRTAPTGYINMVTKKPRLEDFFTGSLSAGSADYKRGSIDWNKSLAGMGGTGAAFRLNAVSQDGGVAGRDYVSNKRWAIAPSLALGLNSPTRLYFDFLHVDQSNVPDGGVPTIGLPGYRAPDARTFLNSAARVNSSNFYGTSSDFDNSTVNMFTARVEHDLSPNVTVRNTTRFGETKQDYMLTSWTATTANLLTPNIGNPATWTLGRTSPTNKNQTNRILTNQTNVSAKFDAGGMSHSMNAGVELIREEQDSLGYLPINTFGSGAWPAANLYNPNPNVTGFRRLRSGADGAGSTTTLGLYAFDTAKLNAQWQITGGLRLDRYTTRYTAATLSTAAANPTLPVSTLLPSTSLSTSDTLVTGKIGVVFKPADNGSIYAAFGSSAQPPGGANFALSSAANSAANSNYQPQKAQTYEVGTKWDVLNKRLALTGALFRTEVKNEVVADAVSGLFYQTGKKQVQGLELGAAGAITNAWGVSAGYSYTDTKVKSGPTVLADGTVALAYTPKHAFTSWTTYTFPIGLTIGGGVRYNGKMLRGSDGAVGTPTYTDGYWVVDAMASYKVSKNVDIQFNLYNAFDKSYVAAINKSGYRYTPGIPRSGRVTANFAF